MYLEFAEYCKMGGEITDEAAFLRLCREAMRKIDYFSFNRLKDFEEVPEDVKLLICDMIPLLGVKETQGKGELSTSYSNDGVSVSYAAVDMAATEIKIESLIFEALAHIKTDDGTPLLYCGVIGNE